MLIPSGNEIHSDFGIYADFMQDQSASTLLCIKQGTCIVRVMKTTGGLLRAIRKDERKMTLEQLCALSGVDTGNLSRIERDKQIVNLDTLTRILDALGVTKDEFFTRQSGKPAQDIPISSDTFAMIPRLSLSAAAGNGFEIDDHDVQLVDSLAFKREWLRKKGLNPNNLELYEVRGESMSPYMQDGDMVMVDHSPDRQPAAGEVWVISQPAPLGVRVKRLFYREAGDLIIRSDNTDKVRFADEIVTHSNIDQLQLIGKVVWRAG